MSIVDPFDILTIKFLGVGLRLDLIALTYDGKMIPQRGELVLEVSLAIWAWRKSWIVTRR